MCEGVCICVFVVYESYCLVISQLQCTSINSTNIFVLLMFDQTVSNNFNLRLTFNKINFHCPAE